MPALTSKTQHTIHTSMAGSAAATEIINAVGSQQPAAVTAAFPHTSAGTTQLLAPVAYPRTVIIQVSVTEVFATGTGAQPTFSIDETASVAHFAATSKFTGAAVGSTFSFGGLLDANCALTVTATAATGSATGALSVSAIAVG